MRKLLLPAVLAMTAVSAYAVPAKPGILQYRNADGTTVAVTLHGDEYGHYYLTEDGYPLMPRADHNLYYIRMENGIPAISDVRAQDVTKRSTAELQFVNTLDRETVAKAVITKTQAEQSAMRSRPMRALPNATTNTPGPAKAANSDQVQNGRITNYPTLGSPNAMILLVEFSDVKFTVKNPLEAFEDLVNKPGYDYNGATGSVKDYYSQNSNGLFTPNFEIYGPITLTKGESYYGASTPQAYDVRNTEMVTDAVEMLHEQRPDIDWSRFDNDGDGFVDSIFIFYAGYGENEGAPDWTIWPHSANLWQHFGIDIEFDGVKINNYACTNELRIDDDMLTGIGTFCHEYGHVVGLPDFYSTTSSSMPNTPGSFEVMDRGSYNNNGNTPPQFSCYDKFSFGWINPRVLTGSEDVTLEPLEKGEALLIKTEKSNEYFMLENRQRNGWDKYIPGHGMLIWHIDFDKDVWVNNRVNVDINHPRVDLIEADNTYGEDTRNGDPFPGSNSKRRFTKDTAPAFKTWVGVDPGMPLTDIYEVDELITFKVKDGGATLAAPVAEEATEIKPTSFRASWSAVAGATKYEVHLCEAPAVQPFRSINVSGTTSLVVEGLNPSTTYTYSVTAMDDERTSPASNSVTITTLEPSFDMRSVEMLPTTEICRDSFRLNWNEMKDAEGYVLDLYYKQASEPEFASCDFTKAADGTFLPDGWSSTSKTLSSMTGYYGEAAPALRLSTNIDRLVMPTLSDKYMTSLKFWYRGNSTDENCFIAVEALVNGTWVPFISKPVERTAATMILSEDETADARVPDFARSLRIVFTKANSGSLCLDDVTYGYGDDYKNIYLDGYKEKDLGNCTTTVATGLAPLSTYYCVVRGYNGDKLYSAPSAEMQVKTTNETSLTAITGESPLRISRMGNTVMLTTDDFTSYSVFTAAGQCVANGNLTAGMQKTLTLPAGVYIIAAKDVRLKIVM